MLGIGWQVFSNLQSSGVQCAQDVLGCLSCLDQHKAHMAHKMEGLGDLAKFNVIKYFLLTSIRRYP